MGILARVKRLLSANVNDLLDRAEDPEKIIWQIVRDMDDDVKEARKEVAFAMVNLKMLNKKAEQNEEESVKWQKNAELGIKMGNEGMSKEALKQRIHYSRAQKMYRDEAEKQNESLEDLLPCLRQLEEKLDEMKRRKDILIAKKRMLRTAALLEEKNRKSGETSDGLDTWNRMVEKVEDMELAVEAEKELSMLANGAGEKTKEQDADVDAELAKLKESLKKET